ncbi:bile salt sulfotransferase 1-like isoform X2 [Cricetulus griseus]|uniref:Sulfotransferase n=1 Tax=Cricetulus griseus TaxID=10029 RepID=A0A9J7H8B6_CRIGR|nr:bile salt sulfotransferase 1-like isoform X2 [Cricetulus griseus]
MESLSFAQNFLVKDDDVFLVTYPRSGTHWMCEILSLIVSKGDPTWVQTVNIHQRIPWVEYSNSQKVLMDQDRPHLMVTHLPIQLFPKSYFTSKAKIIYLIRNPRDVVVSNYYFKNHVPFLKNEKPFDDYLHGFIRGDSISGDWKNHFTVAQSEVFVKIYREKMSSLDPGLFPWSKDC